jgi:hypothetical protein
MLIFSNVSLLLVLLSSLLAAQRHPRHNVCAGVSGVTKDAGTASCAVVASQWAGGAVREGEVLFSVFFLAQLDALYNIIKEYDPEQVYNMVEIGLFYGQLPQYSLLLPNEDVSTVRRKKKSKDCVSLVVCADATGRKISCALIGKAKIPACIKNRV